jgi:radical SAM protein with 4Fe4S-binding SPASM domain
VIAAPPLPRALQLEVTGACNLRCRMCLVRYRPALDRHAASVDLGTFARLVDALPGLEQVTLQGLGEPLLAPDLFAMIEHARARGIRTVFNTNATLLTRAMAERLVTAAPSLVCLSLDGATAATYESIRAGAAFDKVLAHIAGLVEVMHARGADRPLLRIVFVAMRRNVHELPALVRLAARLGIASVRVQNLSHSFADAGEGDGYREIGAFTAGEALWDAADGGERASVEAIFAEAAALAPGLGVSLRLPDRQPPEGREAGAPGCDWPWRATYVRHDGQVQPCCMLMGEDRGLLGDLRTASFPAVWSGEPYRRFREQLTTDAPPEVCRGCAMYRGRF